MKKSIDEQLDKYARLIVHSGLNVQNNQIVVISGSIESYPLVRKVALESYKVGAKEVVVQYHDDEIKKMKYDYVDKEEFKHIPNWLSSFKNDYALKHACFLYIEDENPELLKDVDSSKTLNYVRAYHEACKPYFDLSDNMTNSWCIVGASSTKWANKVYPDMSDSEAKEALWNAIFKTAKIDDNDPVLNWKNHQNSFEKRVKYLNELNLKELHYSNSLGTNLTIGMNNKYLFASGGSYLKNGVYNFPNIPTEEIFSSPDKYQVNGIVYSSLPLNYNGSIVDEFFLEFKDGKVVNYDAKVGKEVLKSIVEVDEGSHYLGELALISYDSPISNMKTLFYNTLYDENASCHLALGKGFVECVRGGMEMDKEELSTLNINDSNTHVDFMIGTRDLKIVGITNDNKEVEIFNEGDFVF